MKNFSFKDILIFLFDFFSISVTVNAPNIMVGYGLIIAAMMISILFTRPLKGASIFLFSHISATLLLIYTHSIFISITVFSLILRSTILFIIGFLYEKGYLRSVIATLASIVIIDDILAYSIGLLHYGHDAIEVGLDIYSAVYIPYIYLAYKYYRENRMDYSLTLILSMILYYFSSAYFYALSLNILSILILLYFIRPFKYNISRKILYALPVIFIIILPISITPLQYNLRIILYPYSPRTLMGEQWIQTSNNPFCGYGNVFKYVHDPPRLRILDTCVTIEGIVVSNIYKFEDGDICFDLKTDPEYSSMLSIGSIVLRHGAIHIEIVPHDQGNVTVPKKGDRIRVTGVLVVDTDHGSWSEIHPAWHIEVISSNSTS